MKTEHAIVMGHLEVTQRYVSSVWKEYLKDNINRGRHEKAVDFYSFLSKYSASLLEELNKTHE